MACTAAVGIVAYLRNQPPPAYHPWPGEPACRGSAGYADAGARTFLVRPDLVDRFGRADDPASVAERARLIAAANAALSRPAASVMDKTFRPPNGNPHEYVSLDNYSWPDPKSPTGWTWRDGFFNPAYTGPAFDYGRMWSMVNDAETLGLAYRLTGDPRYSQHVAALVRKWFLDPATRMNPDETYAQLLPGKGEPNGNGTIDAWRFVFLIDAVGLIQSSGDLSPKEIRALEAWFADYLSWMQTSPQGQHEDAAKNNHADYHDIQKIDFALFSNQPRLAHLYAQLAAERRTRQIDGRGELPEELARFDKAHYIAFGSLAFSQLATLSQCAGVDLWRYKGLGRGNVRQAMLSLEAYVDGTKPWPAGRPFREPEPAEAALSQASWAYHDAAMGRAARSLQRMSPDPDPYERWPQVKTPPFPG